MKLRALFLFAVLLLLSPAVASAQVPSCALVTKPSTIFIGESVTLSWQSTRADSGTITGVKGTVSAKGSINLIPTQSTRFVGTFTGAGGKTTCEAIVLVQRTNGTPTTVVEASGALQVVPEPGSTGAPSTIREPEKLGDPGSMAPAPTLPRGSDIKTSGTKSTGLVPCAGTDCQACNLAQLGQKIINFLVGLSIPLAAAMFAYAGFLYFSSSVLNKIEKAKKIFTSVLIGFAIVVGGFLVVETILHTLLKPDYFLSWNKIQCVPKESRPINKSFTDLLGSISVLNNLNTANQAPVTVGQNSVLAGAQPGPGGVPLGGLSCGSEDPDAFMTGTRCYGTIKGADGVPIQQSWEATRTYSDIAAKANDFLGYETRGVPGTDNGNKACAWAVTQILNSSGYATIGDGYTVASMEKELNNGGRGEPTTQSAAQPGDIVMFGGLSHVGVCANSGCTQVIANSSGSRSVDNIQTPGSGSRYYRVTK